MKLDILHSLDSVKMAILTAALATSVSGNVDAAVNDGPKAPARTVQKYTSAVTVYADTITKSEELEGWYNLHSGKMIHADKNHVLARITALKIAELGLELQDKTQPEIQELLDLPKYLWAKEEPYLTFTTTIFNAAKPEEEENRQQNQNQGRDVNRSEDQKTASSPEGPKTAPELSGIKLPVDLNHLKKILEGKDKGNKDLGWKPTENTNIASISDVKVNGDQISFSANAGEGGGEIVLVRRMKVGDFKKAHMVRFLSKDASQVKIIFRDKGGKSIGKDITAEDDESTGEYLSLISNPSSAATHIDIFAKVQIRHEADKRKLPKYSIDLSIAELK